jgi:predicted TIM-barrel fold metal-dependent hydrolase
MATKNRDRIYEAIRAGKPLDFTPVIDVHGHFGTISFVWAPSLVDPEKVLREMDAYGVAAVCFSAISIGAAGSLSRANDEVLRAVRALPGRVLGYAVLSSNRPERNLDELRRCYDLGLRCGVKMHRYDQPPYRLTDAFLEPVFEFLSERHLVYLNHDLGPVDDLITVARRYPDVSFINGHGGVVHARLGQVYANIYANSCAMNWHRSVEELVAEFGSEHLTLGSDFSLFQLGFGLGPIAYAEIPEADKQAILGANAMRIFGGMEWFRSDPPAGLRRFV